MGSAAWKDSRPAALGPTGWKPSQLHLPSLQSSWQACPTGAAVRVQGPLPGGNLGQEALPHRLEHRQAACRQARPHLQAGGRRDSGPGTSSFLAQALRQGTTPAFLLGIPRERGLWACLPLCSGLQLFLPFLNGSGPAGGVLHTRRAPTTPRTWISTLESLPFSWF